MCGGSGGAFCGRDEPPPSGLASGRDACGGSRARARWRGWGWGSGFGVWARVAARAAGGEEVLGGLVDQEGVRGARRERKPLSSATSCSRAWSIGPGRRGRQREREGLR